MKRKKEKFDKYRATAVVVNDDVTQLTVLAGLLEKEGFAATAFESAETALAALAPAAPPDLIVTDLYMPGIDGWRFCRLLRSPEYEAFNAVPILVVSATFAGDHPERIAADIGADAFLSSPVDGEAFTAQVRALLAGKQARRLPRALIVEDSKTLAGLLKKAFAAHGYRADTALSVREAEDAFARTAYDVAVLDYHLPDGTGDALLDAFRTDRPDCVCLMMTTDPTPELALDWMKRGAAAYLRKPFEPEFLIELCAKACRERALLRTESLLEVRNRELQESEARLNQKASEQRLLLDTIDTQVWYLKDMATYGVLNRSHADFLGLDVKDIAHKRLEEFVSQEVAEVCKASNIEVFRTKRPVYTEEWIPNADGEERLVAVTKTPRLDTDGKVAYVVCAGTDITAQKHAEEALRAEHAFSESIIETAQVVILVLDIEGRIVRFNPYMEALTGRRLDEVKGKDWFETFLKPEKGHPVPSLFKKAVDDIQTRGNITPIIAKDGREILVEWYDKTLKDNDGHTVGLLAIGQDITEKSRLESERQTMERRLHHIQKAESLSRMAGAVAHHFNNMLGAVMGNLELARWDLPAHAKASENLAEAEKAARRAADMSRLMLAYLGQTRKDPKPLDLSALCVERVNQRQTDAPGGVTLEADCPTPGPVIQADPTETGQVLASLMTNAWEAMDGGGRVRVKVDVMNAHDIPRTHRFPVDWTPTRETYACLTVRDTGRGMDQETIARIFDPFFTDKFTDRGLGLSVALGTVKSRGGVITVESEPGRGSTFRVFWPLSSEPVSRPEAEGAAEIREIKGGGTVLLAEDQEMVRDAARAMLVHFGFEVIAARDGAEAVEIFRDRADEIRLVLTDLTMPRLNGWETLTALRKMRPDIPVILASGYDAAQAMEGDHAEQPQVFLPKPYQMAGLKAALGKALR